MCGICGIIGGESAETREAAVRRMMRAMVHRGPDGEGLLSAPPAALGMRRLSILDIPGGNQPIWNETGTIAVIFNGEIYNFRELRSELESSGHIFRTRSDTEVIVHAYEAWGDSFLRRLHGMFALAVVEMPQGSAGQAKRILIARDPLGIKPLYYALIGGMAIFASEVRTLLASDVVPARLSAGAISPYLLFGSVYEPLTMVEATFSLPPGHSLSVPVDQPVRSLEPSPYWNFESAASFAETDARERPSAAPTHVRSLLDRAVASHLVADVPVGVFLSSGLDSTAIAAIASRNQGGVHTFTVAFPDTEFSEAEIARRTAAQLHTEHSELTISDSEMVQRLDEAIGALDQPSMDGINTYFVSWAARQAGLKVALSGLGSDELFGGYSTFRSAPRVARLRALARLFPGFFRRFVAAGLASTRLFGMPAGTLRKALAAWVDPHSLPHPYFFTRLLFPPQSVASGTRADSASWNSSPWQSQCSESARQTRSMDAFTAVSWLELRSYLLNTLLRDTDAMSMAHSLEVRVPFLDLALVERMLSLSGRAKGKTSGSKALLIAALADVLPQDVIAQRKRTFTFPWENWLRGALGKRVAAGFTEWSPALDPHVGSDFARSVWRGYLAGRTTWSRPWSLYVLNEWVKRNLPANQPRLAEYAPRAAVAIS